MWISDLIIFVWIYIVSVLWQLIGFPLTNLLLNRSNDGGWAAGRLVSTISISLFIFSIASFGVPINTNFGLIITTIVFSLINLLIFKRDKNILKQIIKRKWKLILIEEILFLSGIVFMGTMRGFRPNLDNLEKYMDFGFIYQYLLNAKLPATDMWFAGASINYYSFGHFWTSILIRSWVIKPTVGFNLALAFFFGLDMMLVFSVVTNLFQKFSTVRRIVSGLVSVFLVMFGGNSHIVWFVIQNGGLIKKEGNIPYWYSMATRFIDHTIHEFPSYTFTVGDLHAHLLDLPIVFTLLLFLSLRISKNEKRNYILVCDLILGLLLGVMIMTNTWDGAIYFFMLMTFSLLKISNMKTQWHIYLRELILLIAIALLTSSPWWWNFEQISHGIGFVADRTSAAKLIMVWSFQTLFGIFALCLFRDNKMVKTMIITGIFLIAMPEIIYFKDIYNVTPRANTVFKFTYQAFVLFSILGGGVVVSLFNRRRWILGLTSFVLSTILLLYPFTAYPNFYLNFKDYYGLDGERWIVSKMPENYEVIEYLRINRNDKNLLEYPGTSFSKNNSVSVFSGVPSVVGWKWHEWLWRNSEEVVYKRVEEVRKIYETTDKNEAISIINKYKIGWVLVGPDERENYNINNDLLKSLGDIVWNKDKNYLVKI